MSTKIFRNFLAKNYKEQLVKLEELGFTVQEYQTFFAATKNTDNGVVSRRFPKQIEKTCNCQILDRTKYKIARIKLDSQYVHPSDPTPIPAAAKAPKITNPTNNASKTDTGFTR